MTRARRDTTSARLCEGFPDALWCNDFETGELLGASIVGSGTSGFVTGAGWEDTTGFVMSAAPGLKARLQIVLPETVTDGELHIGGRLRFETGPETQSYVVVTEALSPMFEKISFDMNSIDRAQVANTIGTGALVGGARTFPRGVWTCFELAIVLDVDGGAGQVELLLDGAVVLSGFQGKPTKPASGFTVVELGPLQSEDNLEDVTVRADDVIIRRSVIGCPGPA